MSPFEVATEFFHSCESLKGWAGCQQFVASDATFSAQCEPLTEVTAVEGYCEWMAGLGGGPLKGCYYELHSSAYDESTSTALFFGTFHGTHVGEGGPIPATNKTTASDYVYSITMDQHNKVSRMTKIWNAPWALGELGWG
jgi:hypothetical protein